MRALRLRAKHRHFCQRYLIYYRPARYTRKVRRRQNQLRNHFRFWRTRRIRAKKQQQRNNVLRRRARRLMRRPVSIRWRSTRLQRRCSRRKALVSSVKLARYRLIRRLRRLRRLRRVAGASWWTRRRAVRKLRR